MGALRQESAAGILLGHREAGGEAGRFGQGGRNWIVDGPTIENTYKP